MSKIYRFVLVWCVLLVLVFGFTVKADAEVYPLTTVIVSLDYDADVVTAEDYNGNLWQFDGCEDWQVFDLCAMLMDDGATLTIYDDVVLLCWYDGTIDGWLDRLDY